MAFSPGYLKSGNMIKRRKKKTTLNQGSEIRSKISIHTGLDHKILSFPVRLGILGGGQLAKMLALSCYRLGVEPYLFSTNQSDCALEVSRHWSRDDGSDDGLAKFASSVDLLIIENEFLDLGRIDRVIPPGKIVPSLECLNLVQNKLDQKMNLKKFKIPTLDFQVVKSLDEFNRAVKKFEGCLVLKKSRLGYDGHGTYIFQDRKAVESRADEIFALFKAGFDGYAEELAHFKKEIAVVIARDQSKNLASYPVIQTFQKDGRCDWAAVPAGLPTEARNQAVRIAEKVITCFMGQGIFGIEMFWLKNGKIVVNEIAPRVHNSGHLTMNGFLVSQFEQHVRAALSFPLISTLPTSKTSLMVNIIGGLRDSKRNADLEASEVGEEAGNFSSWVYWYGKRGGILTNRKLGHINILSKKSVPQTLNFGRKLRKRIPV